MKPEPTDLAIKRRRRAAAEWFVDHESARDLDRARVQEWQQWCAEQDNRAEYRDIVWLGQATQMIPQPLLPTDEELRGDTFEVPELVEKADGLLVSLRKRCGVLPFRQYRAATWATAAALLVCAIGLTVWFSRHGSSNLGLDPVSTYATAPGEHRDFTLPDHSRVTLGGDSSIVVNLTANTRRITLEHGEALFHVAHDTQRPFTVRAGNATTTAVGTMFDIRRYSTHVNVWVSEGVVQVAPVATSAGDDTVVRAAQWFPVMLERGQEMAYDARGGATAARQIDPGAAAALANGQLVYRGRPLSEVIEDVQRYSRRRILLDPSAAELMYSGYVFQGRIEQWLRGLTEIFPVEIIDCHTAQKSADSSRNDLPRFCVADPQRIYIRSRLSTAQAGPQSAVR